MWFPYYFQFLIYSFGVNVFLYFISIIYYHDTLLSSFYTNLQEEYDYIIVGAGTAGSLIAHRIATETNFTFVVLEAGGRSYPLLEIPFIGPLLHGSIYDWQYESTPQEHACLAMVEKKCKLTQGKIVGGSSKLNNMIHVRGNIPHYVKWFHGKYNEEYFKQHFEYIEKNIFHLNEVQYQSELADAVIDAANELGYKEFDQNFRTNFQKSKVTQKDGKRWTISDNINRHVVTNALVKKVLIVDDVAYGVSVRISDKIHKLIARKGVILSAGTLNTPKILQLSGIGPAELLKSLNIPLIQDLPVGHNLQDHIGTGIDLILFNKTLSINAANMLNPLNLYYYLQGKGPWTTPGCEVIGFYSTKNTTSPDVQFMILPVGIASDRGSHLRKSLSIKDEIWHNYFTKSFDKHTSSFFTTILHPKSKGTVYIKSKNPIIPPLVDTRYLSEKEDIDALIAGIKLAVKLIKTDSLRNIGAHLNTNPFPGCRTCSMGLPESKDAVVDTSFKVLNVKNLYVVDGSVLPTLPSGNINAAIAMMANIFFETTVKHLPRNKHGTNQCYKYSELYEYLFKVCNIV
ncbi:Glucose dehydrogenase [acceptor] [Papilio xuthus]|uniref:Glucose dehydrogenase [acceptor] n=1 Tax=Papilio xuthus TaxID=66420 RepID=A0A194QAU6_PAPXU|nr:Glucose dehydrogenase [acceptor] [Papilio xuthus]